MNGNNNEMIRLTHSSITVSCASSVYDQIYKTEIIETYEKYNLNKTEGKS